jgi:hypothetical protein
MVEISIDSGCLEKVREALAASAKSPEATDNLRRWMNSPCPEVQAIAFERLFEQQEWRYAISESERDNFFVGFLTDCIKLDCENDFRISRYDALNYCRIWLNWECARNRFDRAKIVVKLLSDACMQGSDDLRQAVLCVVLEHVFQNDSMRSCFDEWLTHSRLAPLHAEAVNLAQKWLSLSKTKGDGSAQVGEV